MKNCACIQKPEDTGCTALSLFHVPFRQGLSLNPELGWQPASCSDPSVSTSHSTGVTGTYINTPNSSHGYWDPNVYMPQVFLPTKPPLRCKALCF